MGSLLPGEMLPTILGVQIYSLQSRRRNRHFYN
jgi:hypothetical protein